MMNFYDIVAKHSLGKEYLPLWKVVNVMDQIDVQELNSYISTYISLPPRKRNGAIAKEVVLLCAYWWQKTYSSGVPSIDAVLTSYGRSVTTERDVWLKAIKHFLEKCATSWGINLVKNINTMWFYTALSQGGVPAKIFTRSTSTRWCTYLDNLLNFYDIPIRPTYDQLYSYAINTASSFGAAKNTVALFCSELIVDLVNGDGNFSSYPSLTSIYANLNKQHNSKHSGSKSFDEFRVIWEFKDNGSAWDLCYSIICPNKYAACNGDTYNAIILNGIQTIAEYYEHSGDMVQNRSLKTQISHRPFGKYDMIFVDKRNQSNEDVPCPLLNADAPLISEHPTLLYQNGKYWTDKSDCNAAMGILCPSGWQCCLSKSESVAIEGRQYDFYNIDWSTIPARQIDFTDSSNNIYTIKQPSTQEYSYYRLFNEYEWIAENPGILVVINEHNFNQCLCIMNHTTHCLDPRKNYTIEFKTASTPYQKYSNGMMMPDGYVWIRITMPDTTHRIFRIFCINELDGSITSAGSISGIKWNNGTITPNGISSAESTTYRFSTHGGDFIDIAIINNQRISCFFDIKGNLLANKARIAFKDIDKYRAYLSRGDHMQISMVYDSPRLPASISPLCKKDLDPTNVDGRYSLCFYAKDWVEKCFWLYGFNDKTHHVIVKAGSNALNVYRYHYDAIVAADNVYICDSVGAISNLPIVGYSLSLTTGIVEYKFQEIAGKPGHYAPQTMPTCPIVVISQDPDRSIYPVLFDLSIVGPATTNTYSTQDIVAEIDEHDNLRAASIGNWESELLKGNSQTWSNLWDIWEICKDYDIDYSRMNCFVAITNNPDLQIMFLNRIDPSALGWTDDEIVDELYRMQFELGFAFFYLPSSMACWMTSYNLFKWVSLILAKDGLTVSMLFPTCPTVPTAPPSMFIGEFPINVTDKIYNINGMGTSKNAQKQLQWAKSEAPKFAYAASSGSCNIWTYTHNPKCLMPYERWLMRLINYCLHYDLEDFKSRYI